MLGRCLPVSGGCPRGENGPSGRLKLLCSNPRPERPGPPPCHSPRSLSSNLYFVALTPRFLYY